MKTLSTTKLSSKGQVVIPEDIRKQLGLETGAQFIVMGEDDVVILKAISPPSRKDFSGLISKARSEAREAGLTKQDVKRAIKKARAK
jgi:AbrB family looped-hinge helix DNA binding protein